MKKMERKELYSPAFSAPIPLSWTSNQPSSARRQTCQTFAERLSRSSSSFSSFGVLPSLRQSVASSLTPNHDDAIGKSLSMTNPIPQANSTAATDQCLQQINAQRKQEKMRKRVLGRLLRFVVITAFSVLLRSVNPVLATATASATSAIGPLARFSAIVESSSFLSGLTASFLLVLASEIGDKTFFISALLSMKYSRVLVLLGTMLALGSMTVISVGIGQIFHALPTSLNSNIPFDDYAAVALLLWFGWQNIRDGLAMKEDDEDELQDAKDVVDGKAEEEERSGVRVVAETSSLIFVAEWGDKSMLATVALAAAKSPLGVIVGGISGHFIASVIAVVGGSVLGKYISEKNARLIGGVLFFVFAFLTVLGIY